MKANELMIGDYISTPSAITKVEEVAEIYPVGVLTREGGIWLEDEIQPIPLTHYILEKNGFCMVNMYYVLRLDEQSYLEFYFFEHRLRKCWKGVDEWNNHSEQMEIVFQCNCESVHELQHALRLCGINKDIVL